MVKVLRCSNCGANLKCESGRPNVVCEYCKSFVRIDDDSKQYDPDVILSLITEMGDRVRTDGFSGEYNEIKGLISANKYCEASERLDVILKQDETQARAWFYKSLLPIIEQENIFYKGCYINVVKVSQITNRKLLRQYLKGCGLSWLKINGFLDYYRSTDFLYEQSLGFLNKAIKHASTEERRTFLENHRYEFVRKQQRKLRLRGFATFGLIALLAAVVIGGAVVVWIFLQGYLDV